MIEAQDMTHLVEKQIGLRSEGREKMPKAFPTDRFEALAPATPLPLYRTPS